MNMDMLDAIADAPKQTEAEEAAAATRRQSKYLSHD